MHSLLQRFSFGVLAALFCAGSSVAADLASAKRAYEEKDYAAALKEFSSLAEQGNADAQVHLGRMYLRGQGVSKNIEQALKWYKAAAEQGNADGQFLLGAAYLLPHRDIPEGLKLVRLSADQGNQDAQWVLGKAYMEGNNGVPRDPVQAEMWLRLAAKDNLPFYEAGLAAAERQMSADQIAKGKALAEAWRPKRGPKVDEKETPLDEKEKPPQDAKPRL
jgi:uncharacterized protein